MNKHQQTAYGIKTLIYTLLGLPPVMDQFSTVNERLSILPDARPLNNERVTLGVLIAGNKGHTYQPGADGIALFGPEDHLATDAALYGQLPLALRDMDDDLSPAVRSRYCLRKIENVNGVNKIAYYGLRIPITVANTSVQMKQITRTEQGVIETDFIPDNSNLYPIPPDLPTIGGVTASDVSIKVMAIVNVTLTTAEVAEFVEAVRVLYNGDERYAVMSEFGLCIGASRVIEVEGSAGTINFNESIGTQVYAYAMEHKALFYNTQELRIDFDVGNQIPLFAPQSIPTMQVIP